MKIKTLNRRITCACLCGHGVVAILYAKKDHRLEGAILECPTCAIQYAACIFRSKVTDAKRVVLMSLDDRARNDVFTAQLKSLLAAKDDCDDFFVTYCRSVKLAQVFDVVDRCWLSLADATDFFRRLALEQRAHSTLAIDSSNLIS